VNNGTSFASIVNLSNATGKISEGQLIIASGNYVYATWYEQDSGGRYDVYFISSSDNGSTFGNKVNLSLGDGNTLQPNPAISTAGGTVYVTWQDSTQGNDDILLRASISVPDVSLTYMAPSRNLAYSGVLANPIIVNVTAGNPGTVTASFVISVKANGTFIAANKTVTNLPPGGSQLVQFSWNTLSLARGNYTLTCYASQVTPPGETNLSNNVKTWSGTVNVKFKGDLNADCKVDISDLVLTAAAVGKTPSGPGFDQRTDLNNDGIVDITDVVLVATSFGQTC